MQLFTRASDAASEVKATAERIGQSAQWNTTALVAVTAVSVVALFIAVTALARTSR